MIQISPQQRIWIDVRMLSENLGYDTHDYLPGSRADYPFVFIGEQFKQDIREHKDYLNGQTQVTAHVWHNSPRKRGTVMKMMSNIEQAVREKYRFDVQNVNTQMFIDNSTESDLLHGVLEIDIKY